MKANLFPNVASKFFVFICSVFLILNSPIYAQSYSKGDISLNFQGVGTHDSVNCYTQGYLNYSVTIQNSFVGDSVKIIYLVDGTEMYSAVNISGQNPWNIFVPNPRAIAIVSDQNVSGGLANFYFYDDTKIISGADTIYDIVNNFSVPVSNPCIYGTAYGKIYIDRNDDCIFNGIDTGIADSYVFPEPIITLDSPSVAVFGPVGNISPSGDYSITIQKSWLKSYTVALPSKYQFLYTPSSCAQNVYLRYTLPQYNLDFPLHCTSNVDVQCTAFTSGVIRPLIPFVLSPCVNNSGCVETSGVLTLCLDHRAKYNAALSANPATTVVGDTLSWIYSNLNSLSNGGYWNSFFAGLHITPDSTVGIGDTLCFSLFTDIPSNDVDATNNSYSFCLPVVNSFDPNVKEVSPKGTGPLGNISPATNTLTYTIHFQNTGNAVANEITIVDSLDPNVLASSLRIVGATHTMTPEWVSSNIIKFRFLNIMLPDSTSDELKSHGAVTFTIKLKPQLTVGTTIKNKAFIYFDNNAAIVTNSTINTLAEIAGVHFSVDHISKVNVSPNPFQENIKFSVVTNAENITYGIMIFDMTGKLVKSVSGIKSNAFEITGVDLEQGIYVYRLLANEQFVEQGKIVRQ
ncbi:MAG: T9SS type A sorting domain-containing protein [Chitinophagales bacterium]|nr:T9SS type A sorting domain-containing protein [Chitinophagales bacterium]